jgi:3'-phosphoadenosine 5'-phosphosulfate sulfotransferase (PAPS reductase)/FAD synthetase
MALLSEAIATITADPSIRHIISVSGGKDSAALAVYLKQRYPQIPAEYVFCDTGTELPETYEYLEKMEAVLGIKIKHVNALEMLGVRQIPGRTAFDWLLQERYSGFLPSPRMRWCTRVLKIQPFEHFVGDTKCFSYIGIRADEARDGYVAQKKPPVISERIHSETTLFASQTSSEFSRSPDLDSRTTTVGDPGRAATSASISNAVSGSALKKSIRTYSKGLGVMSV